MKLNTRPPILPQEPQAVRGDGEHLPTTGHASPCTSLVSWKLLSLQCSVQESDPKGPLSLATRTQMTLQCRYGTATHRQPHLSSSFKGVPPAACFTVTSSWNTAQHTHGLGAVISCWKPLPSSKGTSSPPGPHKITVLPGCSSRYQPPMCMGMTHPYATRLHPPVPATGLSALILHSQSVISFILIISLTHNLVVFGDGGVRLSSYSSENRFKFFFKHLRTRPTRIHPLPQKFHLWAALHKSAHNTLFQQAIFCTARYLTDTTLSMKTVWSCHDYLSRHHWQKEICAWTIAAEIFQAIFFQREYRSGGTLPRF